MSGVFIFTGIAVVFVCTILYLWKKSCIPDAGPLIRIWFGWVGIDLLSAMCVILVCSMWHYFLTLGVGASMPDATRIFEYVLFPLIGIGYSSFMLISGNIPVVGFCMYCAFFSWLWM